MEVHNNYNFIPILRYFTLVLLFLALTAKAGTAQNVLVPNYDIPAHQIKVLDIQQVLFLTCKNTNNSTEKLEWKRNNTKISEVESLKGRYEIKENNLIIQKPEVTDAGLYTCSTSSHSADINVIAGIFMKKIPENKSVVEGEKLLLHCKVSGTDAKVTWAIGNNSTLNKTHVQLQDDEDNVKDAILIIEHAELSDRNTYSCTAHNNVTELGGDKYRPPTKQINVRVKGKLQALWPFLGICAEVFILCAIILVYEKKRNKEGLDESDTDQSPEQEKLKTGK